MADGVMTEGKHKPVYLTWRGRMVCEICGVQEKDHA